MPKQLKAAISLAELQDSDRRLASKLVFSLRDQTLSGESQVQINRILNRSRRPAGQDLARKYSNGYLVFYRERFPSLRKSNKQADVTSIAKIIGAEWRALGEDRQQSYRDAASKARDE